MEASCANRVQRFGEKRKFQDVTKIIQLCELVCHRMSLQDFPFMHLSYTTEDEGGNITLQAGQYRVIASVGKKEMYLFTSPKSLYVKMPHIFLYCHPHKHMCTLVRTPIRQLRCLHAFIFQLKLANATFRVCLLQL